MDRRGRGAPGHAPVILLIWRVAALALGCLVSLAWAGGASMASVEGPSIRAVMPSIGGSAGLTVGRDRMHGADDAADLHAFFRLIDTDKNGEITSEEAAKFIFKEIRGSYKTDAAVNDALNSMVNRLDSTDVGSNISEAEIKAFLAGLMASPVTVAQWIAYGVGFPKYSQAFLDNSISSLDFPLLVRNDGQFLRDELGIESELHRTKILRVLRMQILGLGLPPDRVRSLVCAPLPADPGALLLSWEPPAFPGEPVYSRITVEEFFPGGSAASWEAALTLGPGETSVVVPPRPRATFGSGRAFRVTLWSEGGPSAWVKVDGCRPIEAGGEEGGAGKRRGGGAAGGAGVGGGAGAEGGVVPDSAVQEAAAWWTVGEGLAGTLAALSVVAVLLSMTIRGLFSFTDLLKTFVLDEAAGRYGRQSDLKTDLLRSGDDLHKPRPLPRGRSELAWAESPSTSMGRRGSGGGSDKSSSSGQGHRRVESWGVGVGTPLVERLRSHNDGSPGPSRPSTPALVDRTPGATPGSHSRTPAPSLPRESSGGVVGPSTSGNAWGGSESGARLCPHAGCTCEDRGIKIWPAGKWHVCGRCQEVFCPDHTAIKAHGALGGCGIDSKCVCAGCYELLPAAERDALWAKYAKFSVAGGAGARRRWRVANQTVMAANRFAHAGEEHRRQQGEAPLGPEAQSRLRKASVAK